MSAANFYKSSSQPDGPVIEEEAKISSDSKTLSELET